MVTYNRLVTRFNGLSTDEKPKTGRNGDTFYEMDTYKWFMFDEEDQTWIELPNKPPQPGDDSDVVGIGQVGYMKLRS